MSSCYYRVGAFPLAKTIGSLLETLLFCLVYEIARKSWEFLSMSFLGIHAIFASLSMMFLVILAIFGSRSMKLLGIPQTFVS